MRHMKVVAHVRRLASWHITSEHEQRLSAEHIAATVKLPGARCNTIIIITGVATHSLGP